MRGRVRPREGGGSAEGDAGAERDGRTVRHWELWTPTTSTPSMFCLRHPPVRAPSITQSLPPHHCSPPNPDLLPIIDASSPARDPPSSLYASASDETLAAVLDHLKPHTVGTFLPPRETTTSEILRPHLERRQLPLSVPPSSSPSPHAHVPTTLEFFGSRDRDCDPFTSLLEAIVAWNATIGCPRIRTKLAAAGLEPGLPLPAASTNGNGSAEDPPGASITGGAVWRGATKCEDLAVCHVRVLIKGWIWIPNAVVDVYTCHCGVSCVGSKFPAARAVANFFFYMINLLDGPSGGSEATSSAVKDLQSKLDVVTAECLTEKEMEYFSLSSVTSQLKEMVLALLDESDLDIASDAVEMIVDRDITMVFPSFVMHSEISETDMVV
ncbi:Alpha-(14)-fucosyltransferase [Zea mays]|uniref:Alpha-(14)-fucosyltransferase n=1 Tax=Zea mays TaxID=4577 RepID=A0A1D6I8G3_MAIZE|nr:Alpha-(14)-fucosyltransferase [Zea mays]